MKLYHFLKDNLDVIKEMNPALHSWLWSQRYDMQTLEKSVFHNAHGALDWRMQNGQGMFDPVPPTAWYGKWTYGENVDKSATVIIGCNVGYGLNHVLTATPPSHKIVVLEPRPEMLLACLGQTDYTPFLREKRLHFIPPLESAVQEAVRHLDLQFLFGRVILREDTPSKQLGPEYSHWLLRCRARMESFSVEMTTLRLRQDVMVGNELKNFSRAAGDGSLMPLKGTGSGLTGVIFGAGPSLDVNAAHFRDRSPDALYVTSLQALPALQRQGIRPHFCLAIDYSEGMRAVYSRLDKEAARNVPLIYSTKLDPVALAEYPGPTIPLWTLGGLSTFVFNGRELVLDAGGNVGVTMLRLLCWMGMERILLVGQDFACPGDTTHAGGHHGKADAASVSRIYNVKVKDIAGREILTSPQLLAARRDVEDDLSRTTIKAYNLYGGGSPIKGAANVTWAEVCGQKLLESSPENLENLMAAMKKARTPAPRPVFEARARAWSSSLRNVEKRLEKLFKKLDKNQAAVNQLLGQVEVFVKQDPLYTPYLFNEIMDLAGLVRARSRYELRDMAEIRSLFKRIVAKVREMDRYLGQGSAHAA
ncbi:protein of unknown function DUF115 [Desulfovibrio sp. X2]|uniref:motility associated factor glycosyltransferase family protein n=1 Tax=Desulfovibrio sp. X2 TaxID=941449 RepID=UPI000358F053|nr:6-hydroxymethylpterin diphosphokinase MptE-like protein [Desulfovibrio sp. X2]EPR42786.1 protein of unknown function DUF115 [Desulfovibrio sp. X2]